MVEWYVSLRMDKVALPTNVATIVALRATIPVGFTKY